MSKTRPRLPLLALLSAGLLAGATHHAAALTMKECGAQYQAAKTAGTLAGQDWNAYRAAHCGTAAAATAPVATTTAPVTVPSTGVKPAATPVSPAASPAVAAPPAPVARPAASAPTPVPAAAGSAVFPARIDPKYATMKAGAARRKTCDDQYKLNKADNGNGGLPWNQKGGGYYSACNKRLKGA